MKPHYYYYHYWGFRTIQILVEFIINRTKVRTTLSEVALSEDSLYITVLHTISIDIATYITITRTRYPRYPSYDITAYQCSKFYGTLSAGHIQLNNKISGNWKMLNSISFWYCSLNITFLHFILEWNFLLQIPNK